jgi:hypothetical protein
VEQIAEYTFRLFRELERSELGVLKKLLYAQEKRKKTKRKPIVVQTLDPEKSDKPTGVEEQGDDGSEKEGSDADEHEEEEEEEKGDGEEEGDSGKESKDESDGGGWTVVGRKKK